MEIATRCGQDSDCNPSSAAGVLGVMLGYERIPETCKAESRPRRHEVRFHRLLLQRHREVHRGPRAQDHPRPGGRWTPRRCVIPVQAPKAPPLEQWDPGLSARVELSAAAWSWTGGWVADTMSDWSSWAVRRAGGPGDEATLVVRRHGCRYLRHDGPGRGRADVYLDGAKAGEIDAWIPERTFDSDYWHVTGLAHGPPHREDRGPVRHRRPVEGKDDPGWRGRWSTGPAPSVAHNSGRSRTPGGPPRRGGRRPGDPRQGEADEEGPLGGRPRARVRSRRPRARARRRRRRSSRARRSMRPS